MNFRLLTVLATLLAAQLISAADWNRFRGPNGSGVSSATSLPVDFGPETNVLWKTALPAGHSSPIIVGNRIYLTAAEGGVVTGVDRDKITDKDGKLFTLAIDRENGEILWKQQAPRPRFERYQPTNSAASPSPAVDGSGVYVFFGDFGLLGYSLDGAERWRYPLGPFNNVNGHGSSPIVVGNNVVLVCDQDDSGYIIAVNKNTGKLSWKTDRRETTRTYVTPALFEPATGDAQIVVPSANFIASYSARTGEKLWWVYDGGWQPKSTPVVDGERIFVSSWEGGGGRPDDELATFAEILKQGDSDSDGRLSEPEIKAVAPRTNFVNTDLDENGFLEDRDWTFYRARRTSRSALTAIRPDGLGDLTKSGAIAWRLERFLPNAPSPLLYENVLYLVKDGGIFTALDPATGEVLKQGRLADALDKYYSSPIAADGKIYTIDQTGKATVVEAGADWKILSSNDLAEEVFATPAVTDGRLFIRTRRTLYCFGKKKAGP
jgi:outer membrane protein assembly factor BamB